MKQRISFVSNSSSCSFIVDARNCKAQKIHKLLHPEKFANREKYDYVDTADGWNVSMRGDFIYEFYTLMDNFDYLAYARELGFEPVELSEQ